MVGVYSPTLSPWLAWTSYGLMPTWVSREVFLLDVKEGGNYVDPMNTACITRDGNDSLRLGWMVMNSLRWTESYKVTLGREWVAFWLGCGDNILVRSFNHFHSYPSLITFILIIHSYFSFIFFIHVLFSYNSELYCQLFVLGKYMMGFIAVSSLVNNIKTFYILF